MGLASICADSHARWRPAAFLHSALEVAQLNWKGTELVVISACESGTCETRAGKGVYGLRRAIAVAGARSSLLSLWKVNDEDLLRQYSSHRLPLDLLLYSESDGVGPFPLAASREAILEAMEQMRDEALVLLREG